MNNPESLTKRTEKMLVNRFVGVNHPRTEPIQGVTIKGLVRQLKKMTGILREFPSSNH